MDSWCLPTFSDVMPLRQASASIPSGSASDKLPIKSVRIQTITDGALIFIERARCNDCTITAG